MPVNDPVGEAIEAIAETGGDADAEEVAEVIELAVE